MRNHQNKKMIGDNPDHFFNLLMCGEFLQFISKIYI